MKQHHTPAGWRQPRQSRPSAQPGFTVIEMMIVLAVASVILVMVLAAVPTLERNSRNNQRNQDAQTILEAVSHWELNNSGNIPSDIQAALHASKANLTFYTDSGAVNIQGGTSGWSPGTNPVTNLGKLYVYNYQKCATATETPPGVGGSTYAGAGYSDVVALYAIETSHGAASKCEQL